MLDAILSIPPDDWDRFIAAHPNGHVLQSAPWGALKSQFGWSAERVGLADKLDVTVDQLSHGANRQLELGITLAHEPRILLLDEPMAGLSAAERTFMTELIMSLKPEITVVIIEHDIDVAFRIADQVSVLHHGAIIAEGSPKEIENNPEVQQIYTLSRRSKDTQNA